MPVNCSVPQLLANSKCYLDQCQSEAEREAIQIYLRLKYLEAQAVIFNNLTELLNAAKGWQGLSVKQLQAIDVYITQQNAENDTGITNDVEAIRAAARCYVCLPAETRKELLMFLRCELSELTFPD